MRDVRGKTQNLHRLDIMNKQVDIKFFLSALSKSIT